MRDRKNCRDQDVNIPNVIHPTPKNIPFEISLRVFETGRRTAAELKSILCGIALGTGSKHMAIISSKQYVHSYHRMLFQYARLQSDFASPLITLRSKRLGLVPHWIHSAFRQHCFALFVLFVFYPGPVPGLPKSDS